MNQSLRWIVFLTGLMGLAPHASTQTWGPWQLIGPFEHSAGPSQLEEAHSPERLLGSMRHGRSGPNLTGSHRGSLSKALTWQSVSGQQAGLLGGKVDILKEVGAWGGAGAASEDAAAYLYREVTSSRDRSVTVHVGSDDGMRLWLNGDLQAESAKARVLGPHDDTLELALREGTNHLLVKVVNGRGGWAFQMSQLRQAPNAQINGAIQKGMQYLINEQLLDGSWGDLIHLRPGPTAFRVYALLRCGLRAGHPAIQRGRAMILSHDNDATYVLSCKILALCAMNQEGDDRRVADLLKRLTGNQAKNGVYEYSIGGYNSHLEEDLSNSLFAALAMRAAASIGVSVPRSAWDGLARGALSCQEPTDGKPRTGLVVEPRGFRYRPAEAPTSSMTAAGISILEIYLRNVGGRGSNRIAGPARQGVRSGLEWLRRNFDWDTNAGHPSGAHHLFSVYGMERVGSLLGRTAVANRDWYWEGCQKLLALQADEGHWEGEGRVQTSLALLFLGRATAYSPEGERSAQAKAWSSTAEGADYQLRASGDTPLAIWVEPTYPERVADLEWPGQAGQGLHVSCVEYYARRDLPNSEAVSIGVVRHNASKPAGLTRFPLQHRFESNGTWLVSSRMTVLKPPPGEGLEPEEAYLHSGELRVDLVDVVAPIQLECRQQARDNLLRKDPPAVTASSQIQGEEAVKAVDGRYSTRWHCQTHDRTPSITLTFKKAVRGRRILLSHGWPRLRYRNAPRPLRVEVLLNGSPYKTIEMNPDAVSKTVIDLERTRAIRWLELRIKESHFAEVGQAALGFSEIEILR